MICLEEISLQRVADTCGSSDKVRSAGDMVPHAPPNARWDLVCH